MHFVLIKDGAGTTGLKIATTHATANTALRIDSDQTTENVLNLYLR